MRTSIPTGYLIGLAAVFAAAQILLGVASLSESSHAGASVAAMAVYALLMTVALTPHRRGIARPEMALLVVGVVAITVLVDAGLPHANRLSYAAWHPAALQCLFIVMAVRGWLAAAVAGCGLFTGLTMWWSLHTAGDMVVGLRMILAPALFTLVALALVHFLTANDRRAAEQTHQALALLDQAALADARRQQAESWARDVAAVAGPPLRLACEPTAGLSEADRMDMLRAEASLRDRIRGGALATSSMLAAIDRARRNGVVVSLLDDRGDELADRTISAATQAVAALLPRLRGGRLTIRARPAESTPPAVTIAYESDDLETAEYLEI